MVEAIIDTRLRENTSFHDVLHSFCAGKVAGTAILELKLAQELARVDHNPQFLVFLNLREAYHTMDRVRPLMTLEGYGSGSHMNGLLGDFLEARGCYP